MAHLFPPKPSLRKALRKKLYCVIGLLDGQRWAQSYWADTPDIAEDLALIDTPKGALKIAAVLHGKDLVS